MPSRTASLGRLYLACLDHLYTDWAWAYNVVAYGVSGGLWYQWTRVALPFVTREPVLEVGIGRGHLLGDLAHAGHHVVGLDRAAPMVRLTQARLRRQGWAVPLVHADGQRLPFATSTFGTLITTFPARYVTTTATQREFVRVLRPGGTWVWVDAPTLRAAPVMGMHAMAHLYGGPRGSPDAWPPLPTIDPAWTVTVQQVPVGPTLIHVTLLRKDSTEGLHA